MPSAPKTDKTDETPRERFVRLANKRVSDSLAAIDKVGGLANKNRYEYTDTDINAIEDALNKKMDEALGALKRGTPSGGPAFTLSA